MLHQPDDEIGPWLGTQRHHQVVADDGARFRIYAPRFGIDRPDLGLLKLNAARDQLLTGTRPRFIRVQTHHDPQLSQAHDEVCTSVDHDDVVGGW